MKTKFERGELQNLSKLLEFHKIFLKIMKTNHNFSKSQKLSSVYFLNILLIKVK